MGELEVNGVKVQLPNGELVSIRQELNRLKPGGVYNVDYRPKGGTAVWIRIPSEAAVVIRYAN